MQSSVNIQRVIQGLGFSFKLCSFPNTRRNRLAVPVSPFRGGELFQLECGPTKVTFGFSSLHSQSHPCLFLCQGCPGAYPDKAQHPQKGEKFWGRGKNLGHRPAWQPASWKSVPLITHGASKSRARSPMGHHCLMGSR